MASINLLSATSIMDTGHLSLHLQFILLHLLEVLGSRSVKSLYRYIISILGDSSELSKSNIILHTVTSQIAV